MTRFFVNSRLQNISALPNDEATVTVFLLGRNVLYHLDLKRIPPTIKATDLE